LKFFFFSPFHGAVAGIRDLINDPLRYGPPVLQPGPSIWRAILWIAALNDWVCVHQIVLFQMASSFDLI